MKASRATSSQQVYKTIPSPVGQLTLVATDRGLVAILWENDRPERVPLGGLIENPEHPVLLAAELQLKDYFTGKRTTFEVTYDLAGTPFQKAVWRALESIPFGETRTYSQIAAQISNPKAVRAVGAAIGRNPISIIIPCHRVIGSSGNLTGFAGGLPNKASLLSIESGGRLL